MACEIPEVRRVSVILVASLGIISLPALGGGINYVSNLKTIDSLYEACVANLKIANVQCVKGRDYTKKRFDFRMPSEELNNVPAYKEMRAQAESGGDRDRLFRLSLNAPAPYEGPGNKYFVFFNVYKEFYPYSRIPVVYASASIWEYSPDSVGVNGMGAQAVDEYVESLLAKLPIMNVESPQGKSYLASLDKTVKRQEQAVEQQAKVAKQQATPGCKSIVFTGYAAIFPQAFIELNASSDPADLAARNPIVCSERASSGLRMVQCRGMGFFENKNAEILDWTPSLYRIRTDVDFDTGRRAFVLFVERTKASCVSDRH